MTVNPIQELEAAETAVLRQNDLVQELMNDLTALKGLLQSLENLHGTITPQEMETEYASYTTEMQQLIGGQDGIASLIQQINESSSPYVQKWVNNTNGHFQLLKDDVFFSSESKNPGLTLAGSAGSFNKMATFLADMCTDTGKVHIVDLMNQVNAILGQ